MICVLSFSILALGRKAQLADEGLWFSCLLSGRKKEKKKKTTCGGGVQVGRVGKKKMKKKEKKHKGVFLRNEDDQVSLL